MRAGGRAANRARARTRCYYGRSACQALLEARPAAIDRAFVARDGKARDMTDALVRRRVAYREVRPEELDRLAKSQHHEGVVLFATGPSWPSWDGLLQVEGPAQLALVARGLNPHNLGAILRSAAHFGLRGLGAVDGAPAICGASARIAEGAAEVLPYARVEDAQAACRRARAMGFAIVASDARGATSLFGFRPSGGRVVWLFGQEGRGLGAELDAQADARVHIPGTGRVDSVNVSVAAGIVFAELWRSGVLTS